MAFRRFVDMRMQYIAGVSSAMMFAGTLLPNTLGLQRYRKLLAKHENQQEVPLDKNIADMAEEIAYSIDLTPEEHAGLQFFTVFNNEVVHKGSIKLRTGAIIGIPATFSYKSPDEVETSKILVNMESIQWDSKGGQLLKEALLLSEKAKAFAIAREIHYTNTWHVWIEGFLRMGFFFLAYSTGFMLNNLFHLRKAMKRWGRLGMYSVIGGFYFFLYLTMADTYYCWRDNRIDKKTGRMGQNYATGGVEFYEKTLQRNQGLRLLMGVEGPKWYTPYGNQVATWRRPHVQLTVRRDNMQKILKSYDANSVEKQS